MASAALGLTPRWLMLLSAALLLLLLLLLPSTSAQQPSAISKARGVSREPGGRGGGRLGRLQGGAQPAGFESWRSRPPSELRARQPSLELRRALRHGKTGPVGTEASAPAQRPAGWASTRRASAFLPVSGAGARHFEELKSCTMPDSSPALFLLGEIGQLAGCAKAWR